MNAKLQLIWLLVIAALVPGRMDAAEVPRAIDFPLLSQVRTLDLIDGRLGFPEVLEKLDGRRVSLVGFMAPLDSLESMERCMIVPSYVGCRFCNPPDLNQVVYVTQGSDDDSRRSYRFIEEPSHVSGILRLSLPENNHDGKRKGFVYSLENAVVTVYPGEVPKRMPSHRTSPHQPIIEPLAPVSKADLVQEVVDLLGSEPTRRIKVKRVSAKTFGKFVRKGLEEAFPKSTRGARTHAFSLLGMIPEGADWIDTLAGFQFARRVAATDGTGERVHLLDSVEEDHPYVRLCLVGEIADALTRQHLHRASSGTGGDGEDDTRRAWKALRQGIRNVTIRRYASSRGISLSARPPANFVPQEKRNLQAYSMDRWQSLPNDVGPFLIDFLVGPTGPLSGLEAVLARPPSTTMEFFRPLWYQDSSRWRRDPVPSDFADKVAETPPVLTDVLGVGGLIPWLGRGNTGYAAMSLSGQWAGDRWAVWQFPDGTTALLLETRWQDEESALKFRDAIPSHPFQRMSARHKGSSIVRLFRASSAAALMRIAPTNSTVP